MYIKSKLAKSIRLAMALGLTSSIALTSNLAFAQEQSDDEEADKEFEKITVTGSRIRRSEVEAATPVFEFSDDELDVRGFTNVADLLTASPLFGGNQTPNGGQNGFTAGQNSVNLFDLGTQRTLTLVNGRRLVSGTSAGIGGSQVDLNTIPAALVDRVEIVPLTGAATYGADAIAGTVNVILKDDFEGFEVTAQYGDTEDSSARSFQFSTLAGGNFSNGRGNIVFGVEYTDDAGLLQCDQEGLCEGDFNFDSTINRFVDLDGDGQADDTNGDGIVDGTDSVSTRATFQDIQLQLFTEFGAVSPPGGFAPDRGIGDFADGSFLAFAQDGSLQECQPGTASNNLINTISGGASDSCSLDFFDSVAHR